MYYSRHFRSADGSVPAALGPALNPIGTISTLALVLEPAGEVLSRPGLMDKVMALGADWRDHPLAGPGRAELLQ